MESTPHAIAGGIAGEAGTQPELQHTDPPYEAKDGVEIGNGLQEAATSEDPTVDTHTVNVGDLSSVELGRRDATRGGRPHFRISAHHGRRPGGPLSRDVKSSGEGEDNQIDPKSESAASDETAGNRIEGGSDELATCPEGHTDASKECDHCSGKLGSRGRGGPRHHYGGRRGGHLARDLKSTEEDTKEGEEGETGAAHRHHHHGGRRGDHLARDTKSGEEDTKEGEDSAPHRHHHGGRRGGHRARDTKSGEEDTEEGEDSSLPHHHGGRRGGHPHPPRDEKSGEEDTKEGEDGAVHRRHHGERRGGHPARDVKSGEEDTKEGEDGAGHRRHHHHGGRRGCHPARHLKSDGEDTKEGENPIDTKDLKQEIADRPEEVIADKATLSTSPNEPGQGGN